MSSQRFWLARATIRTVVVAMLLCLATTGWAQSNLAATHYRAGASYFQQGKYKDALREFRESYRLSKKSDLLYNIGQVYERMNQPAKAIKVYEEYLAKTKKKEPALRERIANLKATIGSTNITISCNIDGAEVTVDGKVIGKTPLSAPVKVAPGSHNIKVSKGGYTSFSAYVSVTAGASVPVSASLKEAAKTSTGTTTATPPSGDGNKATTPPPAAGEKKGGRFWTWVALGGGAVLVAVGAIAGVSAMSKADSAQTDSDADADSAKGLALLADISLVAGLAAVATGVVLLLMEGKGSSERAQAKERKLVIVPTVSPNGAGVGAIFRF